ncbi:MAG: hypothetical protein IJD20_02940 [Oscillospiraceae bacterium]|nr:hypothetical protein [Oscillospiraceae bacterium]
MRIYTALSQAVFQNGNEEPHLVTIPHTWNALDGQDGGDDYYRGEGVYTFSLPDPTAGLCQFIAFRGVNHRADVFVNGCFVGTHEGGFSAFRFDISQYLKPHGNTLTVKADNAPSEIYPQMADFTFFGGIYRPVYFLEVPQAHFDLSYYGTDGIFAVPKEDGTVEITVRCTEADGCRVVCEITDGETLCAAGTASAREETKLCLRVEQPKPWDGRGAAQLYTLTAKLFDGACEIDRVDTRIGFRTFFADAERGFFLNGRSYPLHGVSRHQDRLDMGWAISPSEHLEDMQLIEEVGANSIRLAHYQHDPYFYDLCDERGMVVWAEIPFITRFMPGEKARENTLSQMRELILQNFNRPSVCFWGISNEITIAGDSPELNENLRALHTLCKELDPTRLTTIAQFFKMEANHPHTDITDVQGVNYYFGWYAGETKDNGPKLDEMHAGRPQKPLAVSEYGVDHSLMWHSATPINHDYTEEYAVAYHYEMLCTFAQRPYLWATYLWTMFDFAADARDEGGVKGRNCKGLVTYDRKTKKDTFFVCKAFWSTEPMVYIAGKRFANRAPDERTVSVFSNQQEVTLVLNGEIYATLPVTEHRAVFSDLPMQQGENVLLVTAGEVSDTCVLNAVAEHDTSYDLPEILESKRAGNWFLQSEEADALPDGKCFDADDPIGELMSHPLAAKIVRGWLMAKTEIPLEKRVLYTGRLLAWEKTTPQMRLREKTRTICTVMTDEDFAVLNRRLHTVPKE